MFDVFISHSRQDKAAADAACAALEAAGVRCWIAPRDVEPGAEWVTSIMDAIEQCKVMVLIFSSNANSSKQVQREVQNAFDQGKPVIPLRVENVALSKSLSFYMNSVHWLDALTPPLEQHLARLTQRVSVLVRPASSTEETHDRKPAADHAAEPHPRPSTQPGPPDRPVVLPDNIFGKQAEPASRSLDASASNDEPYLFISYAAKDSASALEICAAFEKSGVRCWIAPRDIAPDAYYRAAVTSAIGSCGALLLVLSASTSDAHQVLLEVELAAQNRIPIFPLRIENVAPTGGLLYLLANRQILDALPPRHDQYFARLAQGVAPLLRASRRNSTNEGSNALGHITDAIVNRLRRDARGTPASDNSPASGSVDLFINHAAADTATAQALCADLETKGVRCWIAPRDVPSDVGWHHAVISALDRSRAMLLAFSATTGNDGEVLRLVELAALKDVPVYPLSIDDSTATGRLAAVLKAAARSSASPAAAARKGRRWWPWGNGRKS